MAHRPDSSAGSKSSNVTDLVAAAAVIASGTAAYADAVRYENSTGFDWLFNTLDLTKPGEDQMFGPADGSSIYMNYFSDFYPAFTYYHTYADGLGAEVFSSGFSNRYAKPLDAGTLIGPGLADGTWNAGCTFDFVFYACDIQYICNPYEYCNDYGCYTYYYCYYSYDCSGGNRGIIPEGVDTYLGVRIEIDSQTHYGWVKVNRQSAYLEVLAWGYESDPETPIEAGAFPPTTECPGDADGDQVVDINDLNMVLGNFGTAGPSGDLNTDGHVDIYDLNQVLGNFGDTCPEK